MAANALACFAALCQSICTYVRIISDRVVGQARAVVALVNAPVCQQQRPRGRRGREPRGVHCVDRRRGHPQAGKGEIALLHDESPQRYA